MLGWGASPGAAAALAAAVSWGGGDFSGGMGVKAAGGSTAGALRVVTVAHATALVGLLVVCWLTGAAWPHGAPMVWALGAGVVAGISLTAFYVALSRGTMGPSAAVSGLLAAGIPAVVSSVIEGAPGWVRLAGFVLAAVAIWAIAAGDAAEDKATFALAVVGGVGFGFYFVGLKLANPLGVFEPVALARVGSLVTCAAILLAVRGREAAVKLPGSAVAWAMGVALLDTGGNLLFIWATRLGRLDVAAVLASLYPAATILLAAWRLQERPARRQVIGMVVALVAVVMVTV